MPRKIKKLTRRELRNIIDKDWSVRRQKIKNRAAENSQACKDWKASRQVVDREADKQALDRAKPLWYPRPRGGLYNDEYKK